MRPRPWVDLEDGDGVDGGSWEGGNRDWFGEVGMLGILMEGGFSMDFIETEHPRTLLLGAMSAVSAVSGFSSS